VPDRPPLSTFRGIAYRQASPKHAEVSERLLSASARTGGRFNPAGEFGALYVSLDAETPFRELRRQVEKDGTEAWKLLPRTLFAMEIRLGRVLDLTSPEVVSAWMSPEDLIADDWAGCQAVARTAREMGFEAVRYPSVTGAGENLAIFADRLSPSSYIRIVNEERLHG
jgi:RES domain-containing protein